MMWLAIILLLLGCGFLIAEMFVPGFGVFGVSGAIMVICAAVITVIVFPFGIFIMLGEVALVGLIIYTLVIYIKRRQLHGNIILNETLDFEAKDIGDLDYFLGKEGVTKTTLRPFGTADFNGISVEVCSDGMYITENKQVKVSEINNGKIIVKQINTNS